MLLCWVANALANILPINGKTTGELSSQYPNLFVPAGITFSIWGLIYFMLLIFMVTQFISKYKEAVFSLKWLVIANFSLNAMWIMVWHYEFIVLSLLVMILLLLTLIKINIRLIRNNWLMQIIFGIYLGWICVATIANTSALLVSFGWNGFGISDPFWAIGMIIAGSLVGAITMIRLHNPFLVLALVWGFYGIILKQQIDFPAIAFSGYIGIIITTAISVYVFFRKKVNR
jgi:hypothetical protein